MLYFISIAIVVSIYLLELSLLPHIFGFFVGPFIFLPFISILALKDKTIFPIILAAITGMLYDANVNTTIPVFTITFLSVALISKIFLGRFLSYGEIRAYFINLTVGLGIIYSIGFFEIYRYLTGWSWLMPMITGTAVTYLLLALFVVIGQKYFTWVEKETEERYR